MYVLRTQNAIIEFAISLKTRKRNLFTAYLNVGLRYIITKKASIKCPPPPPHRHSKPFNPLLGETYEVVNTEDKYCVIAEQVSHHPPITALHVESEKWVFWEEYKLEVKFRGQVGNGVLEWDFGSIGMGFWKYWNGVFMYAIDSEDITRVQC